MDRPESAICLNRKATDDSVAFHIKFLVELVKP